LNFETRISDFFMLRRNIAYALAAYGIWGFFPVYWRWLQQVAATELIAHRIGWSFLLLLAVVLALGQWSTLRGAFGSPRVLGLYALAAVLLSSNWLLYIWAVHAGFIVESSLGYFINPLLSVLLGVVFLRERLRSLQWLAVGLLMGGVTYLAVATGRPPWIALGLAGLFAVYGLIKKLAPLPTLAGLTLETGILFLPALGYLLLVEWAGRGAFLHTGAVADGLMIGAGVVTTVPLLLFNVAARRIPLSLMGLLQYITPTLQLLLGVLVYREPFDRVRLISFGLIWLALLLYSLESLRARRTAAAVPIPELGEG